MVATTYANIVDNVETTIYAILSADTTIVTTLGAKVVSDVPEAITRGQGFPYVVVNPASINEDRLTFSEKNVRVTSLIEVYSSKAANARKIADAVRNALKSNISTSQSATLWRFMVESTSVEAVALPEESAISKAYTVGLNVSYEWVGAGN